MNKELIRDVELKTARLIERKMYCGQIIESFKREYDKIESDLHLLNRVLELEKSKVKI